MSVGYERQPCKTDKPIKMPFGCGLGHWGGARNHLLGGYTWAHTDLPRSIFSNLFARSSSERRGGAAHGYQFCSSLLMFDGGGQEDHVCSCVRSSCSPFRWMAPLQYRVLNLDIPIGELRIGYPIWYAINNCIIMPECRPADSMYVLSFQNAGEKQNQTTALSNKYSWLLYVFLQVLWHCSFNLASQHTQLVCISAKWRPFMYISTMNTMST